MEKYCSVVPPQLPKVKLLFLDALIKCQPYRLDLTHCTTRNVIFQWCAIQCTWVHLYITTVFYMCS